MLHTENYLRLFQPEMMQYLQNLPYDICRTRLYTVEELLAGADPRKPETMSQCFDQRVYRHYADTGFDSAEGSEVWAQQCHDMAITNALNAMLAKYSPRRVVGIMGGHVLARTDEVYRKIVLIARSLAETGWLVTSGGGPGAMEAAHLGTWVAGRTDDEVEKMLEILKPADFYSSPDWVPTAYEVRTRFPRLTDHKSIAIPTWLFGREPPNLFATHVAKFFSNSIREDSLITSAFGGILLLPGSAGTFREIFQNIVQNHYLTWEYPSPMVFVGREYWSKTIPIYPVLRDMLKTRKMKNLLVFLADEVDEIVDIIHDFENLYPMIRAKMNAERA